VLLWNLDTRISQRSFGVSGGRSFFMVGGGLLDLLPPRKEDGFTKTSSFCVFSDAGAVWLLFCTSADLFSASVRGAVASVVNFLA